MLKDIIDKKKSKKDYIERKKKGIWNLKKNLFGTVIKPNSTSQP